MKSNWEFLNYIPYVYFVMALLSHAWTGFFDRTAFPRESLGNLLVWSLRDLFKPLAFGLTTLSILTPFSKFALWHFPSSGLSFYAALLLADFIYYWKHRAQHRFRFLWIFHSVHHSSNEFNLSTAFRTPWFGQFIDTLFYVPAVLLGFKPTHLMLGKFLVMDYQYWIHTRAIGKLGWLEKSLNTPSNHRVHHGNQQKYWGRNLGGVLIVWDRRCARVPEPGARVGPPADLIRVRSRKNSASSNPRLRCKFRCGSRA